MNLSRCCVKLISLALPIALISVTCCGSPAATTSTTPKSLSSISITPSNPGIAVTSASLLAYDASNYPTQLYSSTTNSGDTPGYGIKFSSPVVANGKVYISTGTDLTTVSIPRGEIDVYGLK